MFNFNTTDALFLYLFGKRECFINLNLEEKDFKICTEALIKARTNYKCDECDRDTDISDKNDITEDNKEVICNDNDESHHNAPEQMDEKNRQ